MSTAGTKLIDAAKEAVAIAKGEQPAARITYRGHAYVPEATSVLTDDQRHAIYSAYKGIAVLATMCRKAKLTMGEQRSKELLDELEAAFPELPGLLAMDR